LESGLHGNSEPMRSLRVLVAVDDTDASLDALSFAEDILPSESEVLLLNVATSIADSSFLLAPTPLGAVVPPPDAGIEVGALRERARSVLAQARAEVGRTDLDVSVVVDEGDAASRICDTAASAEVDLVVVGTNDRGLFERMWMGSVSRRVVAAAPCPVLVVR